MTMQSGAVEVLNRNIVQTEFFHIVGEGATLEEVFEEIGARLSDQAPIKTTVRFYDPDGSLTKLIVELEQAENRRQELEKDFFKTRSYWRRWLLSYRASKHIDKLIAMKKQATRLAIKKLHAAVKHADQVALEQHDQHFRFLKQDEAHELVESISNISNMWIFVFKPNYLLADKHTAVAHTM